MQTRLSGGERFETNTDLAGTLCYSCMSDLKRLYTLRKRMAYVRLEAVRCVRRM